SAENGREPPPRLRLQTDQRRRRRRLVPRTHGVRPPCARKPLHSRRSTAARDAKHNEPQGQVSRKFPSLRPGGFGGESEGVLRSLSPQPLHAACGRGSKRQE